MNKTLLSLVAVLSLAGAAFADQTPDHKVLVLKNKDGAAILGYDAVAYFTDNKPAKGNPKFQSEYEDAKYYFASSEHKVLFDANPAKYAPAFGGYCGYAASIDRLSPISPEWFQIIDGRLILQHNQKATDLFNKDRKARRGARRLRCRELFHRWQTAERRREYRSDLQRSAVSLHVAGASRNVR